MQTKAIGGPDRRTSSTVAPSAWSSCSGSWLWQAKPPSATRLIVHRRSDASPDSRRPDAGVVRGPPERLDGLDRAVALDERFGQFTPGLRGLELGSHGRQSLGCRRGERRALLRLARHDEREPGHDLGVCALSRPGLLAALDRLLGDTNGF